MAIGAGFLTAALSASSSGVTRSRSCDHPVIAIRSPRIR